MTTPTQGEVRTWARAQGMTVNERGSLPARIVQAYLAANGSGETGSGNATATATSSATSSGGPATGSADGMADLAGGLRGFLDSIDAEVRAVTALSEQIDVLVSELNEVRDEQAQRLLALDELRAAVPDASLRTFLDKAIRPRKVRVPEVVPERLQ